MGLEGYSGPIEFADNWHRALELNGITVERDGHDQVTKRKTDVLIEQGYVVRRGNMSINILGSTICNEHTNHDRCVAERVFSVTVMPVSSRKQEKSNRDLAQDVHRILSSSGANSFITGARRERVFRSRQDRRTLMQALSRASFNQGLTFSLIDSNATEIGVAHGLICSQGEKSERGLWCSLGTTLDAGTGQQYSFVAVAQPAGLKKALSPGARRLFRWVEQIFRDVLCLDTLPAKEYPVV
jgi:hypothetical protein